MLRKVKKILIIVLAFMILLLAIISYFAYIKYSDKEKMLLKEELQNKISLNIEIPDENKKIDWEATENGISVFNEVVFDGLTMDELANKLDKSLTSTLTGTGKIYAETSIKYGVDPYLMVSISLLETGCKWGCSYLTRECNNVGGMKGYPTCPGTSFRQFDSLEDGIEAFIANISNNYYKKGLTTAELMANKYANGSTTWASKVNNYFNSVKAK